MTKLASSLDMVTHIPSNAAFILTPTLLFLLIVVGIYAAAPEYLVKKMPDGSFQINHAKSGETKYFKFEAQKDGGIKATNTVTGEVIYFSKEQVQLLFSKYRHEIGFSNTN